MGIVTEKQFLTTEELQQLKQIQQNTQAVILELGEIELIKIQIAERYENAKEFLSELKNLESEFHNSIFEKYGKSNVNPETGEIIKIN
jgi:hypothetical protein